MTIANETCKPCKTGEGKLTSGEAMMLMGELEDWTFYPDRIEKRWEFKGFKKALQIVATVAEIAHQQQHHPDFHFGWGYVELVLCTHSVGGLTRNDFIVAAKIDGAVGV